ncbi:MAG TPA: DUF4476 domain-containing protein [Flavobacterium sp.]|jgi:hypothetical protein
MKIKITFCAAFLFIVNLCAAQMQPFGHLTIFSEDGDKFYLILNGEKINDIAQANLRVEELTQPYYNAKIIFEDNTKQEISKNYLQISDADDAFMDVTYKIKRDKNNSKKMKLNFFSMTPVVQGYIPPANVQVIRFGHPGPMMGGSVTHSTTTTTTSGGNMSAAVNVGGVGVNVSINDPMMSGTVTQTSTTTTSSSSSSSHNPDYYEDAGCRHGHAMSQGNFTSALQTVKGQNFDDTRLKTAKQIASSNCLSATQIAEICKVFGFEETKLDFAKFAYTSCTEQKNYFKVNNVFAFSSSVDELTDYISAR